MTAPVASVAPITAPIGPDIAALARDPSAAMEETIRSTLAAVPADTAAEPVVAAPKAPVTERRRDSETGQFVSVEAQVIAQESILPTDQAAAEVVAEPVVIPDGYVAATPLAEDKARGFKVRDAEGEIVPPDLTWQINTATGPRELTTDKLISYAQMGVYNHDLQQRAQSATVAVQQKETQLQEYVTYVQQLEAKFEALLQSDDAYLTERAAYEAQNTPEAQRDRAVAETRQVREEAQLAQVMASGQQFFNGQVTPAVQTISQALPTVTTDEIGARLFLLTEHLRVPTSAGPLFPTSAYPAIEQAMLRELVPWAQQLHESRSSVAKEKDTATTKAQQEAEAARSLSEEPGIVSFLDPTDLYGRPWW